MVWEFKGDAGKRKSLTQESEGQEGLQPFSITVLSKQIFLGFSDEWAET